jgi:hypothetical protein
MPEYLPHRTLSFAERLEMARLGTDGYQEMLRKQHIKDSLIHRYAKTLIEDAKLRDDSQKCGEVDDCVNELGLKSPVRKKNNLD